MAIEWIMDQLSKPTDIMGVKWLHENQRWAELFIMRRRPWYEQLERDLTTLLGAKVTPNKLISCYRDMLRDKPQILSTIFEIHGASLLATAATQVVLHVPRGNGSEENFDVQAKIR